MAEKWRDVEEELPQNSENPNLVWVGDQVWCKGKDGRIFDGRFDPIHREWRESCFYLGKDYVTHWTYVLGG